MQVAQNYYWIIACDFWHWEVRWVLFGWDRSRDNRTAPFRILGSGKSLRIECRLPGADCNVYLAFAAALASGLDGIRNKIEPPPPLEGNIYFAKDLLSVPQSLVRFMYFPTHHQVCVRSSLTLLNRTPTFDWCAVRWGSKNKHHKDTCSKEVELRLQMLSTISPWQWTQLGGPMYSVKESTNMHL